MMRWPPLLRLVGPILMAACLSSGVNADVVCIVDDESEAWQARLMLISAAECEIDLAYYAMDGGQVSRSVVNALCTAADRGVTVRVLVDGWRNHLPTDVRRQLVDHGVDFREFHPLGSLHPQWLNQRLHDKLLVVDYQYLLTGSRNLEDHHFGLRETNYIDRDVFVCGCAAQAAHTYFMERWESDDVRPSRLRARVGVTVQNWFDDRQAAKERGQCCPSDGFACSPECEPCLRCVPVCFLSDFPYLRKRVREGIETDINRLFESAQHEIIIESPYLVLSKNMREILLAARRRGVAVRMLTNSAASTDEKLAQAAYENDKRELLRAGVELAEYPGPDHLHAKSAVVDGRFALIGSYNFDARSEFTNSEVAVLIDDPCVATELTESILIDAEQAFVIGADGKPLGSKKRYPDAKAAKRVLIQADRAIVPLLRRLL
ncbi:MAG: phosphatidylserine/phosphatidylglycerophosphate/cardiolipin synthase family protein [Planctomycetaceae bacterium]|nr:phosphatidylserine/phosphatidylglycerophosphate/cardiolipin synthase family protein [Planctomycetaceae bacterium]